MFVTRITSKITSKSVENICNSKIPVKMTQSELTGEYNDQNVAGGRTIVVGVKLDSESRELLTWALVKAAHPGDRVIALHVLNDNGMSIVFDYFVESNNGFCYILGFMMKLGFSLVQKLWIVMGNLHCYLL